MILGINMSISLDKTSGKTDFKNWKKLKRDHTGSSSFQTKKIIMKIGSPSQKF